MTKLEELPEELLLMLPLDYPSALALAATNKHFRRVIDPLKLVSDHDKVAFMRQIEISQICLGYLARYDCYYCYRSKLRHEFDIRQTRNHHQGPAERRYCIDCGLSRGFHRPGDSVVPEGGGIYRVCPRCIKLIPRELLFCCCWCRNCGWVQEEKEEGINGRRCARCILRELEESLAHLRLINASMP